MRVLEKVSRAISRNYNIRVVFKGNQACTDNKMLVLPMLPENLDEEAETLVRGYCDHEIGHLKHSSFEILKEIAPREKPLCNLIEDIRIERELGKEYPGARVNMEVTMTHLTKDMNTEHPLNALWVEGRREICGYGFKHIPSMAERAKELFGADIFDKIKALTSSEDALGLTRELLRAAEQENRRRNPRT